MGEVRVEIECQDEENTFHTTYNVQKYPEYTRRLEHAIRSCFSQEGIRHCIVLNQNPPKGFIPYQNGNVKNWYVRPRQHQTKVRYPRLGSFEVLLRCPSGFARGVPEQLLVWSKLNTRRWPDPERLANDILRLLISGQQEEDVSELLQKLRVSCSPPLAGDSLALSSTRLSATSPSRLHNPPMFFSMSARTRVPTPVEIRTPQQRHAESRDTSQPPPRPMSATSPSRQVRPSSGSRQRPASAGGISSSANGGHWIQQQSAVTPPGSPTQAFGDQVAADSPGPQTVKPASPSNQASTQQKTSWGEDEDPFESEPYASLPPSAGPTSLPAQVATSADAEPAAHPPAAAIAFVDTLQESSVPEATASATAQPAAHAPALVAAVAPDSSTGAPQQERPAQEVAAQMATTKRHSATKLGDTDDPYDEAFEDDPSSPVAARTPTTQAGDNTLLSLTQNSSAPLAEPMPDSLHESQAREKEENESRARAELEARLAQQEEERRLAEQAAKLRADLQAAETEAVAKAEAERKAMQSAKAAAPPEVDDPDEPDYDDEGFEEEEDPLASRLPAKPPSKPDSPSRDIPSYEIDEEGFEDDFEEDDPSPPNLPAKPKAEGPSRGSASTETRGGENEEHDLDDGYDEGFEEDVEEDIEDGIPYNSGQDRILVEGQSYDYAEDNESIDEFSDMSREVSMDDARSVKSVDD